MKIDFATGNWGCGSFGGDLELKTLQQWIASSIAELDHIVYCTAREDLFKENFENVIKLIEKENVSVAKLYSLLVNGGLEPKKTFNVLFEEL